jgi:hypothetical protein
MDAGELIAEFRALADDKSEPFLWDDASVLRWLNEAQDEAAERARLLYDTHTPACCTLTLAIGESVYRLHDSVVQVIEAHTVSAEGKRTRLCRDDPHKFAALTSFSDHPSSYAIIGQARSGQGLSILLDQPALAADTLKLSVYRVALQPMELSVDDPEIAESSHRKLVYYALGIAFQTRDREAPDTDQRSTQFMSVFDAYFGAPRTAAVKQKLQRHRVPVATTRGGGW